MVTKSRGRERGLVVVDTTSKILPFQWQSCPVNCLLWRDPIHTLTSAKTGYGGGENPAVDGGRYEEW
jgi:hypothetical protein